ALRLGQQARLRAERCGVADVADAVEWKRWDQTDAHGARDGDVVAEAASEHQLRDPIVRRARDALQEGDPRGDRALGELDLPDVLLREDDFAGRAAFAIAHDDDDALLSVHLDTP